MQKRNVIPIINNKGGVAKTTTAVTVSSILAKRGYKTLLIDLDQQYNATTALGVFQLQRMFSIYDIFFEGSCIDEVAVKTDFENLYLVPSSSVFSSAATRLVLEPIPDKDNILNRALNMSKEDFDYIIIDCPPSLNQLIVNAIIPATNIVIPTEPTEYSTMGLKGIIEFIGRYSPYMQDYKGYSVLVTSFEKRRSIAEAVVSQLKKVEYLNVYDTLIARSAAIKKAEFASKPINYFDPKSQVAISYEKFVDEMIEKFKD